MPRRIAARREMDVLPKEEIKPGELDFGVRPLAARFIP